MPLRRSLAKYSASREIGTGTPIVVVDNGSEVTTNVAEVATRGGRIVSIGSAGSSIRVLDDLTAPWGPLQSVIPMQIFARTLGLALGWDVDKPRNLAKSVTVE
jgi:glutamine---fructose-6-phosphate transaminase (isomerizing)